MYPKVEAEFTPFTSQFEGHLDYMYLDVKGLVTIGYGNLIDPIDAALDLPFAFKNGPGQATPAQVRAEWTLVKGRTDLKLQGGRAFGTITTLQIPEDALNRLMAQRLSSFQQTLKNTFTEFETWPADGQLGLLSMAWAMGPAFSGGWPHFTQACLARDWNAAAANCKMDEEGNPGLRPRNVANAILFRNAAQVVAQSLAPDTLYYPCDLTAEQAAAPLASA